MQNGASVTPREPAARGWERLGGVAGLLFIALVLAAVSLTSGPEADAEAEILDYFTDSGNQTKQVVAAFLFAIGGLFFIWYLAGLRERMRAATAPGLSALAATGGVVFVTLLYGAIAVSTAIPATYAFSDTFTMDVQTARVLLTLGFSLAGYAGIGAAVLVAAVSAAARRPRVLPSWLVWSGFVLSALLVFSLPLFGLPLAVFLLWVLATSIVLIRSASPASRP